VAQELECLAYPITHRNIYHMQLLCTHPHCNLTGDKPPN